MASYSFGQIPLSSVSMHMRPLIPQKKKIAGFSLIELAIALLIMAILMSAGLSLATVRRAAAQRDVTQTNQEVVVRHRNNRTGYYIGAGVLGLLGAGLEISGIIDFHHANVYISQNTIGVAIRF